MPVHPVRGAAHRRGGVWRGRTGGDEACLVLLSGTASVSWDGQSEQGLGPRPSVFESYPHPVYLPPGMRFVVLAPVTTRRAPTSRNAVGRYYMANRSLPGALGPQPAARRTSVAPTVPSAMGGASLGPGAVFARKCAICHGVRGDGTAKGPALTSSRMDEMTPPQIVAKGVPGTAMFAFGDVLSQEEIQAMARYVTSLRRR